MVTIGSMIANVAGYLLQVLASRWLGPAGYSEFATLLGAQLVLAVPALALQTVVARELVHGASAEHLRRMERRCGAIVAVVAAVFQHLGQHARADVRQGDRLVGLADIFDKLLDQQRPLRDIAVHAKLLVVRRRNEHHHTQAPRTWWQDTARRAAWRACDCLIT